jgi:hypothetical protein
VTLDGELDVIVRYTTALKRFEWQDRRPSVVNRMTLDMTSGQLHVPGSIATGAFNSTGAGTITGAWSFNSEPTFNSSIRLAHQGILRSRTGANDAYINLARVSGDNSVVIGDASRNLLLFSAQLPQAYDGTTYRDFAFRGDATTITGSWTFNTVTTHNQSGSGAVAISMGQSTTKVGLGAEFPTDLNAVIPDSFLGANRFIQTGINPANPPPGVTSNRWSGMEFGFRAAGGYKAQILFPQSSNEMFIRNVQANVPTAWRQVAFKDEEAPLRPAPLSVSASRSLAQTDENRVLVVVGASVLTLQVPVLAIGTSITMINGSGTGIDFILAQSGTTIYNMNGDDGLLVAGNKNIAGKGFITLYWVNTTTVYVVGAGIS